MLPDEEFRKLRSLACYSKSPDAVSLGVKPRKPFVGSQKMCLGLVQQIEIDTLAP